MRSFRGCSRCTPIMKNILPKTILLKNTAAEISSKRCSVLSPCKRECPNLSVNTSAILDITTNTLGQCLSQDLETGCLKWAVKKLGGVQIFKGDLNILIFQP